MNPVYFPKNIWKRIKILEFQLSFPKNEQLKLLDEIRLIINSSYFFLFDSIFIPKFRNKIDFDVQYNNLKINYPKYWCVFTDIFLRKFIKNYNEHFYLINKIS